MQMEQNAPGNDPKTPEPEKWVARHGDYLYRYALSRVGDRAAAEDVVQETLVAALRGWYRFQGRSRLRTWLTGILKYKIIDHLRSRRRELPTEDAERLADAAAPDFDHKGRWKTRPHGWGSDALSAIERKEFRAFLFECLAGLPERTARIFVLREMQEHTTEEICAEMGISATNSWTMLHRARMALRRCLESLWLKQEK
jgi:RNA polymerase sigma-70 factor (ECF subfamily)